MVWLGLRRHDGVPEARAARQVLVKQSLALELQNWRLSRHVMENINSICGAGEDGNGWGADPFCGSSTRDAKPPCFARPYHNSRHHHVHNADTWGSLLGHVALLEAGF